MPKIKKPRKGSMAVWPRKRAKKEIARVRSWANLNEPKPLGFSGYKVGMTHLIITDNRPNSMTKGEDICLPVTVIECPPIKAFSLRFYKKTPKSASTEMLADNLDKALERKLSKIKNKKKAEVKEFNDLTIMVHTQPRLTGIGKKKPEIFELHLGGIKEKKLEYAKELLGKEIKLEDVFSEGDLVDVHAVSKGKGYQGPVKRFGIGLKSHKSEKSRRAPGSLGPWKAQGKIMFRVAHAGQMGYWQRTEFNKAIMKISNRPEEINPKGGFKHYGVVRNSYLLLSGSVPGPVKRIIRFNHAIRPGESVEAPNISYIATK